MNIMEKLVPSLYGEPKGDVEETEAKRPQERNHGPRPVRHITNGQIRRMMARQQATLERKRVKAFRRRWMDNRLGVAVLRGQLETLDKRSVPAIERNLVEKFGSVDAARQQYAAIMAEAGA